MFKKSFFDAYLQVKRCVWGAKFWIWAGSMNLDCQRKFLTFPLSWAILPWCAHWHVFYYKRRQRKQLKWRLPRKTVPGHSTLSVEKPTECLSKRVSRCGADIWVQRERAFSDIRTSGYRLFRRQLRSSGRILEFIVEIFSISLFLSCSWTLL